MSRVIKNKELVNTRLATNYGGWMYCDKCNENIGYLCYSTYDRLELKYKCNCESQGSVIIDFEDSKIGKECNDELILLNLIRDIVGPRQILFLQIEDIDAV